MEAICLVINGKPIYFEENEDNLIKLLHDDDFTLDYVMRAVETNNLLNYNITSEMWAAGQVQVERPEEQPNCPNAINKLSCVSNTDAESIKIWANNKISTTKDIEGTEYLLELRGSESFKKKFNDKKHSKMSLWGKIAIEMQQAGFNVGEGKEGAERCRQKFANLQRGFITFMNNVHKTGEQFQKQPPYYEKLFQILGNEDRICPKNLKDSLTEATCSTSPSQQSPILLALNPDTSNNNSQSSTVSDETEINSQEINSQTKRKSKFVDKLKKPSLTDTILKIHNEQTEIQTNMFHLLQENLDKQNVLIDRQNLLIENQNKQRDAFIEILQRLIPSKEKKRKRKSSSSSDD